jgi:hypothetical protein
METKEKLMSDFFHIQSKFDEGLTPDELYDYSLALGFLINAWEDLEFSSLYPDETVVLKALPCIIEAKRKIREIANAFDKIIANATKA